MKFNRNYFPLVIWGLMLFFLVAGCGKPEPESIWVYPQQANLNVDESIKFNASVVSEENEKIPDASVTWSVEGEAGTIDENGKFTAQKPGEATVIASYGDLSARREVTVSAAQNGPDEKQT
jgi:hypothetical protein